MGAVETVDQACWIGDGDKAACPLLHRGSASRRANDRRATNNRHGDRGNHASGCGGGAMTEEVERRERGGQNDRPKVYVCV